MAHHAGHNGCTHRASVGRPGVPMVGSEVAFLLPQHDQLHENSRNGSKDQQTYQSPKATKSQEIVVRVGTDTFPRGKEERSLSNGAIFPPFGWTGTRCEIFKRPHFTKTGQEPECGYENAMLSGRTIYVIGSLHLALSDPRRIALLTPHLP